MGSDGLAKVIGNGDVSLEMDNGSSLLLRCMKHISNIRMNLISKSILDDEGYYNTFSDGYGLDEFKYRLYDLVENKLVRSHDVVFMEDQTIRDVENAEKVVPQYSDGLKYLDLVPFTYFPTNVEHNVQDNQ
ncbi:hypothetical protein Patl1_10871 [Pistacia atlantica]|uniref:Uncharacterized protein n=1 Tax=Pistacia atlantica TaxID=434234 RepID=A0ACC1A7I6_9ROSI|nr:hypothetical protein Patl1_10871 [Pistacia atlantica]